MSSQLKEEQKLAKKKKEKKRKVKKFALRIEMFFVCFLETKRWTESFGGASSEEFEVLPVCPPVC